MPYATELEAKIAKKVTRAIVDHNLIEDGDRVMVGLSGGKDSWALIQILDVLQKRAPIDFSIVAVNIDSGYEGYEHHKLTETCAARGWELHVEHTNIGETIEEILDDSATPCSLCARLRRGALYRLADTVGATKIALGHHADDFIETLLLNIFFQGSIKAMPARLVSDNGKHVVIRPLAYVLESEARQYAKASSLPIIGCCCPACGDLSLQRQRMKRLVAQLEVEHPEIKNSILRALGNVQTRHLLTRVTPVPGLETHRDRVPGLDSGRSEVPGLVLPLQLVRK
jgi:tRNA 2-thiocytidine biosynthesis protein TtcA